MKINQKRITNSKELRKLRPILRDPVAKAHFLTDEGDIDSSMLRVAAPPRRESGLVVELDAAMDAIRRAPWTVIEEMKGDPEVLRKIEEAESVLRALRANLSPK